jgi:hypothetical protein
VVNKYYDLATSFYEYGWGESFHFAHRQALIPKLQALNPKHKTLNSKPKTLIPDPCTLNPEP